MNMHMEILLQTNINMWVEKLTEKLVQANLAMTADKIADISGMI